MLLKNLNFKKETEMEIDITNATNTNKYQYKYYHQMTENFDEVLKLTPEDIQNNGISMVQAVHYYDNNILIEINDSGFRFIYSDQYQNKDAKCGWITDNVPCHNYRYFFKKHRRGNYQAYVWNNREDNYVRDCSSLDDMLQWFFKRHRNKGKIIK